MFSNGNNLLEFTKKPKLIYQHSILDNLFYSVEENSKDSPEGFNNDYKNYYFPKILCMVSTQNFFRKKEEILNKIYKYYSEEKKIKKKCL